MVNVLVCVKRVPGSSGEILLTPDAMSVDAKYVGYMVSPHEECAVELAIQIAGETGGEATVLSLGSADSVEQLRSALAVGCKSGILIETDAAAFGAADVAATIADVVNTGGDTVAHLRTHLDLLHDFGARLMLVIALSTWAGMAVTTLLVRALMRNPQDARKEGSTDA